MHSSSQIPRRRAKSAVALALTFSAGIVDIVAYITIYHLFVAHMTGSTVHLGNNLATGEWSEAARAGSTLLAFFLGSILGRAVIEVGLRLHKRTVASITLLAEAMLVLFFIRISRYSLGVPHEASNSTIMTCVLLSLLAAAMGIQTATLTRIGPLTIHTTFVTGMLNKLAQAVSQWAFWLYDQHQRRVPLQQILLDSAHLPALQNAELMFGIWSAYMIGSVAGTWMNSRWSTQALYVAVAILLVGVVVDRFQPLSVEEEKEQA